MSLEREGGIKVVQKRAPAVEDGGLILGGRYGVVDVLTGHRPGEHLAGDLTHPVWEHPHIGDGLLGGQDRPALISVSFCRFSLLLQQEPPSSQMRRRCFSSCRAGVRGAGAWHG